MKKLIFACLLSFIVPCIVTAQPIAYGSFTQTNMHTVATNLTWNGTNVQFKRITLIGYGAGGVSNTTPVYIGARSNETYYVIAPGSVHVIEIAPPTAGANGQSSSWWLRTPSAGDGLFCIWNP